jgi:uncharacterized protein YeaO (DUF488 family)
MKQLRIKRVYEAPARDDGVRVLVDRLWPRGLSKEKADVEIWAKDVAPSTELRKWFGHVPARWADFQQRYTAELRENSAAVTELVDRIGDRAATLVYGARDTEHNGAIVLRDYILAHHRRRLAR